MNNSYKSYFDQAADLYRELRTGYYNAEYQDGRERSVGVGKIYS